MRSLLTWLAGLAWAVSLLASGAPAVADAATGGDAVSYPMSSDIWTLEPPIASMGGKAASASFVRYEGMPRGTMTLNEGVAGLKTARFSTGVIEFDMKPLGYNDAGLVFHRDGAADGEFVYLRANPDCPAANDCIQYAPITHTMMGWNVYANYQGPAPISPADWNHLRIEVVGGGMRVFVNHEAKPSLAVPRLWGLKPDGALAFKGPAVFANLVVDRLAAANLQPLPAQRADAEAVTDWRAAPPTPYDRSGVVSARAAPAADAWRPIAVEPTGLVDLGRAFGLGRAPSPSVAWLKTQVTAKAPMRRTLRAGFAEQLWVFLNGDLVYKGVNAYYPEQGRLAPDGRLEPDNAVIPLDLRAGSNEIIFAVGNDWSSSKGRLEPSPYGWAAEAHLDQAKR